MATAFRSSSGITYGSRTNTVIPAPSGIANGDVLVIAFFIGRPDTGVSTPTWPSGFIQIAGPSTVESAGFYGTSWLIYKVASGESGDYTATHTTNSTCAVMLCVSGGDTGTAPLYSVNNGVNTSPNFISTALSITTVAANSDVYYIGHNWTAGTGSPPSGFTERYDLTNNLWYAADKIFTAAGATGNVVHDPNLNTNTGDAWGAFLVGIRPLPTVIRTGTASQINGSAGNGSTSVTVPADCTLAVAFWMHYYDPADSNVTSLTLNGVAFTIQEQLLADSGVAGGTGVATLLSPATGTQTFAWTYTQNVARNDGGMFAIVYVKGANAADLVRDTATATSSADPSSVSVTLTTATTDLVLAAGTSWIPSTPVLDGTVFVNDYVVNHFNNDVSELIAGASTTTINMSGQRYGSMAGIALKASAVTAVFSPDTYMQMMAA